MTARYWFCGALLAAAFVTGCSGAGSGTSPGDSFALAHIPAPGRAVVSFGSGATSVPLPATTGYNGTIALPATSAGSGSAAVYVGIAPQGGTTVPVLAPTQMGAGQAPIPLIYLTFTPTASLPLGAYPGFTITLPSDIPIGPALYLGYYDSAHPLNGYALALEGPATVAGSTARFTPPPGAGPTWQPNNVYAFVLYEVPTSAPSPSASGM